MPASISKFSSSVRTSIEVCDRIVKVTSGCFSRNGVVSSGIMASAVGIAAMRTWPARPLRAARISSRMVRVSPTMRRAHSSTRWPSGVRPWKREPRLTSMTPSCSSSCLIAADSDGWVMPHSCAARPKCSSRASAMKNSSLSIMAKFLTTKHLPRKTRDILIFRHIADIDPVRVPQGRKLAFPAIANPSPFLAARRCYCAKSGNGIVFGPGELPPGRRQANQPLGWSNYPVLWHRTERLTGGN